MDITAYLGEYADQLVGRDRADLEAAFETITTRYPIGPDGDDWPTDRTEALSAAAQLAYGDSTLTEFATAWTRARATERAAMAALTGAIAYAAQTTTETDIAEATGLNRGTVRKALGK